MHVTHRKRFVSRDLVALAARRPQELAALSEAHYHDQIESIADEVLAAGQRIVMLTGPSAAGKTTSAHKIADAIAARGHRSRVISLDDFYIGEGKVHVVFDTIDGRVRSVVSFEAGSIFNLAPAATRREASGQYQCMTDAVIWQIPGKVLHDPSFAAQYPNLMLSVIELLGTLVLTYHTYLTDMLMDDFVIRFSRFLISLSLERGSDNFPLGMTQEQLASVFGVHRATLARAIQYLKQEAIIACFTCRHVEIIDMERLRHMAHL